MYKSFPHILIFGYIFVQAISLKAQLPPNQPEQDCINALDICTMDTLFQLQPYTGRGNNPDEVDVTNSCIGKGAVREVWYIFTVQESGDLCFTITQLDSITDDYDWAVFNITNASCQDIIDGDIISEGNLCNFAGNSEGCGGRTGANGEITGPCAAQKAPCLEVQQGEVYVLNVSTFVNINDGRGYTIDWEGSSAIIGDNRPPELEFAFQECGNDEITVEFSENVVCETVTPTDFSITGPSGNHVVTRVRKPGCDDGLTTFRDSFILEINPPITTSGQYTVSLTGEVLDNCGNPAQLPSSQSITLNTLPALVSATPEVICTGDTTTLTVTGIDPENFEIAWTPVNALGSEVNVNPDTTTQYNVEIRNLEGCLLFSDSVVVEVRPRPTSTFTVTDSLCTDEPGTITYTGNTTVGASFTWNFAGASIISGSAEGPYEVSWSGADTQIVSLFVEANGCVSPVTEIPVTVFQTPSAEITLPEQACEGSELVISYAGNATPAADYLWNFDNGDLVGADTATGPGPHTLRYEEDGVKNIALTVTENGCAAENAEGLTITPPPIAEIAPLVDQCFSINEYQFTYSGPNTNIDSYNWDFGDGNGSTLPNPTHTYNSPGIRTVQLGIIDEDGCLDITVDTLEVFPEPSASFTTGNGCVRDRIMFENGSEVASPGRITRNEWDYGDGSGSAGINPGHRYIIAGTFNVNLRVITDDGCTDTTSQTVEVFPTPDANFEAQNVCLGDSTTLIDLSTIGTNANSEINSWEWDFGDGTFGLNQNTVTNNYNTTGAFPVTLRVTSNNGCSDSITQDITIFPSNQPIEGIGDTVCFGESALLRIDSVLAGSRVDWYNQDTSAIPFFTGQTLVTEPLVENQIFFVESTSPQGCISAREDVRASVLPRATGEIIPSDTLVEIPNALVNFELAGNINGEQYSWSFGDDEQSTSDAPAHQYQFPGKYNVRLSVIDVDGCIYEFQDVIEVIKLVDLFAPSAFSPNGDGINDEFFVQSRLIRDFQIRIFNRWGQQIYESTDPEFRWDGFAQGGEAVQEGVYIYVVKALDSEGDVQEIAGSITIMR